MALASVPSEINASVLLIRVYFFILLVCELFFPLPYFHFEIIELFIHYLPTYPGLHCFSKCTAIHLSVEAGNHEGALTCTFF